MTLAERLYQIRERRQFIHAEAARRCAMTQSEWQKYETGNRTNPTLKTLAQIAAGFGMSVSELLHGVEYEASA